jgi:MFS family permease
MTNFQFTIALMVFLIAYALFEVPSNYMLKRLKPSNWIAFLMLSWGAITMGLGGVQSFGAVTAVRFLLGVFEAGLFPGLVCECRFRLEDHLLNSDHHRLSHFLVPYRGAFNQSRSHSRVGNACWRFRWYVKYPEPAFRHLDLHHTGAIAYGVGHMNGTSGLSAWRWLFILEGLPSILSAVAVFFLLPDYPETSRWLTAEDKQLAANRLRLEGSHGHSGHMTWADAKATLLDVRLYAHYIVSCSDLSTFWQHY